MHVVVVTGLSGAGKSTALRALEDIEFYVLDNIPMPFVTQVVEHLAHHDEVGKVAVAIDARQATQLKFWGDMLGRIQESGHRLEVMFLESNDDVLLRRFSETRRRHPLAGDDLEGGIAKDRALMKELRPGARVIDTSNLSPHQLKAIIQDHYGASGKLAVTLLSFGFKHGLPAELNHVFDVRFLPNPHFVPALKPFDGRDQEVAKYVFESPVSREMLEQIERMLRFSLPQFQDEGKLYVTIAVGCTGGRHRSVAVVEELRRRLGDEWDILVRHRDVDRGE
jgi:UPF0042 nucleotide-binding protein